MNEAYGAIEGNIRYFKTELKKKFDQRLELYC